jgi:DNA repair protein RecO (recombination protein O)
VALVKDIAVTLRRLDYSETSQILVMFTREHGQQRLIAKGIKRSTKTRTAVGIDLLELGRAVFSLRSGKEDNLATLTEWRQEDTFPHLRRDLARLYAAQYAAEVTSQLTEVHDPHPGLFDALAAFLQGLAGGVAADAPVGRRAEPLPMLNAYLWKMLTEVGLQPELTRCVGCGRDVRGDRVLYFSSRQGGAVCRDCEPAAVEKRRLRLDVPAALLAEHNRERPSPTPARDIGVAAAAFDILDYHITEIMARPPRLSSMLRAALPLLPKPSGG